MRVKDKFLEKNSWIFLLLVVALFSKCLASEEVDLRLLNYNQNLKNTSAFFIQTDGGTIEEGEIYVGSERVRVEYNEPEKISLVLSKKKSMYVNHELRETEFFNTNKSVVNIFFKILVGENSFENSSVTYQEDKIIIKSSYEIEGVFYSVEVLYENNPIILRKIKLKEKSRDFEISFFNHKIIEEMGKKFFALINPYQNN
tara:strand:+ start:3368 stop:3967 length:600 start_codon:yes stop_codon:yes gene_type:complete